MRLWMLSKMEFAGNLFSPRPLQHVTISTTLHSCIHQEDLHLRERVEAPISLLLLQQVGV